MAKSIIIQKNGVAQTMTVDMLRVSIPGGGSEDWVPEDGKNLVELEIGGSGTYRASDYSAYGISMAHVVPKYGGGATPKAAPKPDIKENRVISISEGGKSVLLNTKRLMVNTQGGGTSLWVPKDAVDLKAKHITKSGTYPASADECYGFSEITVSGVDVEISVDEDGDDVAIITDGGGITEEKLPSSIVVEIPPVQTLYTEGDTIDFSGMVVKAYTKSGELWTDEDHPDGTIPLSELIFPVTTAVPGEDIEVVDDELATPLYMHQVIKGNTISEYQAGDNWYRYFYSDVIGGPVYIVCLVNSLGEGESIFVSMDSFSVTTERTHPSGWDPHRGVTSGGISSYDNYSAYVGGWTIGYDNIYVKGGYTPVSADQPIGLRNAAILAINKAAAGEGRSVSVVPVDFIRPYDGQALESSFGITVISPHS